jgi:hypothetical protein
MYVRYPPESPNQNILGLYNNVDGWLSLGLGPMYLKIIFGSLFGVQYLYDVHMKL